MRLRGSCLCGAVAYELASEPKAVTHCHCTMCQKQHGAAFATYGSVPKADLTYLTGEQLLRSYSSSARIVRKFCSACGSSIQWAGSEDYPGWVSIALATLDTPFKPKRVKHSHEQSMVCWLAVDA